MYICKWEKVVIFRHKIQYTNHIILYVGYFVAVLGGKYIIFSSL